MWKVIKTIIMVGIIGMLVFVIGTCAWQNCRKPDTGPEPPSVEKAQYRVKIKSTGRVIYSDEVVTVGMIHNLKGYWEAEKGKYVYHDAILTLDEKVFGEIEVKKR